MKRYTDNDTEVSGEEPPVLQDEENSLSLTNIAF